MTNRWCSLSTRSLFVALLGVAGTLDARAQAPGDAAVARQFLGIWRLVSWTQRATDGTTKPGQANTGYIVYADVGRMCAVLMDSGRAKWDRQPPATVADAMARTTGLVAYCAAVELHAKPQPCRHHAQAMVYLRRPGHASPAN